MLILNVCETNGPGPLTNLVPSCSTSRLTCGLGRQARLNGRRHACGAIRLRLLGSWAATEDAAQSSGRRAATGISALERLVVLDYGVMDDG